MDLAYSLKYFLRVCDCLTTQRKQLIEFRSQRYPILATYWWNDVSQKTFQEEIFPYFDAIGDFQPKVILDIGAATGHFSVLAAKTFPNAVVYAFEPSYRQRLLFRRNARLNDISGFTLESVGLWSNSDVLPFRTVGAESSVAPASRFQGQLTFPERITVLSLDEWMKRNSTGKVDLIKIDAEGAELEILQGAQQTLMRDRPRILAQAYHLRDGTRTFERCAEILRNYGYRIREYVPNSGFLVAE